MNHIITMGNIMIIMIPIDVFGCLDNCWMNKMKVMKILFRGRDSFIPLFFIVYSVQSTSPEPSKMCHINFFTLHTVL